MEAVAKNDSDSKVTRISADSGKKKATKAAASTRKVTPAGGDNLEKRGSFIGYFKGAWYELRQVHWPNRSATWSLTGAVLAFTAFFIVFILLLDALFKFLFELILK